MKDFKDFHMPPAAPRHGRGCRRRWRALSRARHARHTLSFYPTHVAYIRQSRPNYGLGFHVEVLKIFARVVALFDPTPHTLQSLNPELGATRHMLEGSRRAQRAP